MYIENERSITNMRENLNRIEKKEKEKKEFNKFELLKKIKFEIVSTLRDSGIKRTLFKIYCRLNKKKIFDKNTEYRYLDDELNYTYLTDISKRKIVVYTAIFGDYDDIQEPIYVNSLIDYVIFTDKEVPETSAWKKLNIEDYIDTNNMDSYTISKYIKLFPHVFFKEYTHSIWVDGTTKIWADLYAFVDRLNGNAIGMFDNPVHDCIYTEANFLIYYNRVPYKLIKKQIRDYRAQGYPFHNGMYECTIIVREHNVEKCKEIMEEWWNQIRKYTLRDQISLPYVLWKQGINREEITLLGENRNFNPRISFSIHKNVKIYTK